MTYKDLEQP